MALKPWYKVVTPREDLRDGRPLDASEFAVHLDKVRRGEAPLDYQDPQRFFERTYLTKNLSSVASEVIRRLSGITTETSAIFNMSTQFGGGKTHALTLLYHLARIGPEADKLHGVKRLLEKAGVNTVPKTAVAVFVGTEFDGIAGRGGSDGTPLRKTPWGEIAFQVSGEEGFAAVSKHDESMTAPAGDVIRSFLPKDRPCLILLDELMNYVSSNRKNGMAAQLYNFLQNLSETVRGEKNVVLAVSIPASELEMNAEDQSDFTRLKKLLDRLGKAVIMSSETETSEIIRRRLFEWHGLPDDARKVINEYADWVTEHHDQIPDVFPIDQAREAFMASYPFHPMVLSVFERKWQMLPRFQQTRGILRLLALWVSSVYQAGYKGAYKSPLIALGSAPLDDSLFRAAVFEQLGDSKLEGAVTADICGKPDSFAIRLDKEANEAIKAAKLHRKVATTVFFESNGGMMRGVASLPEIRLAVGEPDLDIGNVETVLDSLLSTCYFLAAEGNRYRFSVKANLNKLLSDRRASIKPEQIAACVRNEVQKVFSGGSGVERVYFPEKSNQIPDRPALTLAVLPPDVTMQESSKTLIYIEELTTGYGNSARTFKSGIVWCVVDSNATMNEDARKFLAWKDLDDEIDTLPIEDSQKRQLPENLKKTHRDLKESVWRSYKNLVFLGKDNKLKVVDLGLVHSSAADSLVTLILNRLRQDGDVETGISPNFLIRNWPPAFTEWSVKSVRDAFYASPLFPKLLNSEVIKDTIVKGVCSGLLGYVGKVGNEYKPFAFNKSISAAEIEISEDMFVITKESAEKYLKEKSSVPVTTAETPEAPGLKTPVTNDSGTAGADSGHESASQSKVEEKTTRLCWNGDVPPQKYSMFYMKILSKFATGGNVKLSLNVEINQPDGISQQKIEETKVALRELGLDGELEASK